MKIMIVCSTNFYDRIEPIKEVLQKQGHKLIMPNCYDEPETNEDNRKMTDEEYCKFYKEMYYESRKKISEIDAILVLNYTKIKNEIEMKNYIGASTFLEMYEAFMQNKKIYMMNDLPDNMLYDEIKGFNPTILNGDLNKICLEIS